MTLTPTETPDLGLIEDNVKKRLFEINSAQYCSGYQSRIMKSGIFQKSPVKIISQLNLSRKSAYYQSLDSLSHQLSLLDSGLFGRCMEMIDTIILIPEFVSNRKYLLTHTFDPEEKTLGMYLYPNRFNTKNNIPDNSRLISSCNARLLPLDNQDKNGILASVIKMIGNMNQSGHLHSFIMPQSRLKDFEIHELNICHDLYNLARR